MGLAGGSAPLPYGHSADAAVDIEGLSVREGIVEYLTFPEKFFPAPRRSLEEPT
jgi:hypothetical protein